MKATFWQQRLIAAPLLLGCALLQATSVPQLSSSQLVAEADTAITGTVIRTWSEWDAPHKFIWTRAEIQVHSTHKGKPGKTVIVNELGGVAEGKGMQVAGSVQYVPGERVVVFLKHYPGTGYRTLGWGQGKYAVDAKGILHADQAVQSIELIDLKTGHHVPAQRSFDGLSVDEAHRQIAAHIRAGGAK